MISRHKRRFFSIGIAVVLVAALVVAMVLRFHAPPEVARLLPESDAILYLNLKPARAASHFDQAPVHPSPEYAKFMDETGFRWDRDLDRIAISLHRMSNPNGPNGNVAYSGVLEGRFDGTRLLKYLQTHASARETYAGHDIYSIPGDDGRILRVAALGYDSSPPATAHDRADPLHHRPPRRRSIALLRLLAALPALSRGTLLRARMGHRPCRPPFQR